MPDHRSQTEDPSGRWWLRLLVVIAVAAGLGVAVNYLAMPSIAREFFARTPADELVSLDEQRKKVTRKVAVAIIAGMLGPPEEVGGQKAEEVGGQKAEGGGQKTENGERRAENGGSESGGRREENRGSENGDQKAEGGESSTETAESGSGAPPVPEETPVYEIDRRELNRRLQKPERVRGKVTVVSERGPDGEYQGLGIVEVQGWFGQYGLHRGDVVSAINGQPVTTRQQAVSLLMGMRQETEFTLTVERHDNDFEIRYHIPHIDQ
ncbi:MAG: PDZ domain-containing protein [Bradymonadaceae bacterium]